MSYIKTTPAPDANRDPITGAPGAHPVGTGIGAALGDAAAGAATGAVAGPVGTVIRAVLGAIVGGLAGKGAAESIEATRKDANWRERFTDRPGIENESSFDDCARVYGYGANAYIKYPGRRPGDSESDGQ